MIDLRVTLAVSLLVAPLVASPAASQTVSQQPQIIISDDPGRDKSKDEPYDVPELFGSKPFKPGELKGLAPLLVEYAARAGNVYERISIFENGVVSVHVTGKGREMRKALIIAPEALETYRTQVRELPLEILPRSEFQPDSKERAWVRVVRNDAVEERSFRSTDILPHQIENFRALLLDLLHAISEDNQVTNKMVSYVPRIGDRLISEDDASYEVKRLLGDGTIVEVELVGKSTKMYVPAEMLYKMFVDARPPRSQ